MHFIGTCKPLPGVTCLVYASHMAAHIVIFTRESLDCIHNNYYAFTTVALYLESLYSYSCIAY